MPMNACPGVRLRLISVPTARCCTRAMQIAHHGHRNVGLDECTSHVADGVLDVVVGQPTPATHPIGDLTQSGSSDSQTRRTSRQDRPSTAKYRLHIVHFSVKCAHVPSNQPMSRTAVALTSQRTVRNDDARDHVRESPVFDRRHAARRLCWGSCCFCCCAPHSFRARKRP